MQRLSHGERLRIAAMRAERSRQRVVSGMLHTGFMRWRYRARGVRQILITPRDLRTADPSFWREFELDHFGLASTIAPLSRRSPFEIVPPNTAWEKALMSFDWLRHLDAAMVPEARDAARALALEWTIRSRGAHGVAWEPDVAGRRIISWLQHAGMLLDGADQRTYDALANSLEFQIVQLASGWRQAAPGHPRLLALLAILLADVCVAGHDRHIAAAERAFATELDRQILRDGGHVSRNPAVLIELMLDLLPLRQCFAARKRPLPPGIPDAMQRIFRHLRLIRMGDGMLARFNGVSVAMPAALSTVLAYDEAEDQPPPQEAPASGYARLEQGQTIVVADVGSAPALEMAAEACAGCLSFEMSVGSQMLLMNGGAPGPASRDWTSAARATASHNTLVLDERSSAEMVDGAGLEDLIGGMPIRGPEGPAFAWIEQGRSMEASHAGYAKRHGLVHARRLELASDGRALHGVERLGPTAGQLRLRNDLPFAIHFHLNPAATARRLSGGEIEITPPGGAATWRFNAEGAQASIEESIHFADSAGPRRAVQIVLRGTTFGETVVRWRIAAVE